MLHFLFPAGKDKIFPALSEGSPSKRAAYPSRFPSTQLRTKILPHIFLLPCSDLLRHRTSILVRMSVGSFVVVFFLSLLRKFLFYLS